MGLRSRLDINRNFIRESLPNGADYLWKTAKTWLTPLLAKRQFLYLATIEPHVAYTPKKEFLAKYWDKPYSGPLKPTQTGVQLGLIKGGKLKINDNDKGVSRGAARRRDHRQRRALRQVHRRPQGDGPL